MNYDISRMLLNTIEAFYRKVCVRGFGKERGVAKVGVGLNRGVLDIHSNLRTL